MTRKIYLETRWDGSRESPTVETMRKALQELRRRDPEHPDTWLSDDDGWTISVTETGTVTLDHETREQGPWHMTKVSTDDALKLWLLLAEGRIDEIRRWPWVPGDEPVSTEERDRQREKAEKAYQAYDQAFMDTLGNEDATKPCREPGCTRGSVQYSVMCRVHHFEMVRGRPWKGKPA